MADYYGTLNPIPSTQLCLCLWYYQTPNYLCLRGILQTYAIIKPTVNSSEHFWMNWAVVRRTLVELPATHRLTPAITCPLQTCMPG